MRFLLALGLSALAACGADGAPERPGQAGTGLTVSGSVEIGVTGGG